jgi:glucan phosphoethanolaminetransferase (alkaline phosphatase superfamily)
MKTDQSIFKVFQQSEEYFEILSDSEFSRKYVIRQLLFILLFSFIYGIVMGSYNGLLQSVVTGIKIPILILLSLLICFPALYVIQYMIGSTMSIFQMTNIILSGFIVFSTIALSFSPIVIFFMITSDNYAFLKLLHVAIFTFSGIFAVKTIIIGLTFSCEKKNIYPKLGMKIFKIWVVILAFVSSQLAWNLRPFIGSRDLSFELFRKRESNFYVAVIQSVANIFEPGKNSSQEEQAKQPDPQPDSTSNKTYVERR